MAGSVRVCEGVYWENVGPLGTEGQDIPKAQEKHEGLQILNPLRIGAVSSALHQGCAELRENGAWWEAPLSRTRWANFLDYPWTVMIQGTHDSLRNLLIVWAPNNPGRKGNFSPVCHQAQAHTAPLTTGQDIKRHSVGTKGSNFIGKASRLRIWWTSVPKNHFTWVRIHTSFILKGRGYGLLLQNYWSWNPLFFQLSM